MKRDYGPKLNTARRRAGDNFVPLLFVMGVPIAALVFWLTARFVVPRDTLSRFVPADAVAYVHANGTAASDVLLSFSPSAPAEAHPSEAAAFATRDEGGVVTWALLVAWDVPRPANDAEKRVLGERGATSVGKDAWIIADHALAELSADAVRRSVTFRDDRVKSRALSAFRAVAPLQAYVASGLVGAEQLASLRLDDERPLVAGITADTTGIRAVVLPAEVAAKSRLGFGAPDAAGAGVTRAVRGADVIIAGATPAFDVATALFGVPAPDEPRAESALSPLRGSRVTAMVSASNDEGGTGIALHYPELSLEAAQNSLAQYIAAVWPHRRAFLMPDKDTGVELVYDVEKVRFEPVEDGRLLFPAFAVDTGIGLLYLSQDESSGSLLATSLDELIASQAPKVPLPRCAPSSSEASLIINEPALFAEKMALWKEFSARFSLKTIVVNEFVDKGVSICGYTYPYVDK